MAEPAVGAQLWPAVLSVAIGLGLAAACGFRVFVPLLIASLAARLGHLPLATGFEWLGSLPAAMALATATALEIGAYYIPWLDHALDALATPAAVLAGMLVSASVLTELPTPLRWTIALLGGGATAGLVQGASVLFRLKSSALTGGVGNPAVSTAELIGAVVMAMLAILVPLAGLAAVLALLIFALRTTGRLLFGRRATPSG